MNRKIIFLSMILLLVPNQSIGRSRCKIFKNVCVLCALKSWLVNANCVKSNIVNTNIVNTNKLKAATLEVDHFEADSAKITGDLELNRIKKDGSVVSWPSTVGGEGTFLVSDGAGNLAYETLQGDVTGTQNNTIVSFVAGQTAANVALATIATNSATSSNTPDTIVKRDGSGNFNAGVVQVEAGSVLSPTLKFNNGTNTGISAPDENRLSFGANGGERVRIDDTETRVYNHFINMSRIPRWLLSPGMNGHPI